MSANSAERDARCGPLAGLATEPGFPSHHEPSTEDQLKTTIALQAAGFEHMAHIKDAVEMVQEILGEPTPMLMGAAIVANAVNNNPRASLDPSKAFRPTSMDHADNRRDHWNEEHDEQRLKVDTQLSKQSFRFAQPAMRR